jgi:hypothetical protein
VPFSQATITSLATDRDGNELYVSWESTSPPGTYFQVYLARRLVWFGRARSVHLPWPGGHGPATAIDVGTVDPGEATTDLSATLPAAPANRARLAWRGGTYLSDTILGFRIYRSPSAGTAVDPTTAWADITAYPGGIVLDGAGLGGAGWGGAGRSASEYTWTSATLTNGTWTYAIVPYDAAGQVTGTPPTTAVTITVPPLPPAANAAGRRLTASYDATTHRVTLNWLASPG